MRVDLSEKQAKMLRDREVAKKEAADRFSLVLTAILADYTPCEVESMHLGEDGPHVVLKDAPEG